MTTKSEQIDKLASALNKVQAEIKPAAKDGSNPFFHSSYSTLASVWDACRDSLAKHGFAVVQSGGMANGKPTLVTTLLHSSGQWISGEYELVPVKPDPQSLGSSYSYARRYCLAAMVGVVSEDDDAESATSHQEAHPRANPYQVPINAPQADSERSTAIPEAIAEVEIEPLEVKRKEGEKNGKAWTKYRIVGKDGSDYQTFDKTFATVADQAAKDGKAISVKFKATKFGKEVVSIEEVVPF